MRAGEPGEGRGGGDGGCCWVGKEGGKEVGRKQSRACSMAPTA